MKILKNVNLKAYNTFHLNSIAENFYQIEDKNELNEINQLLKSNNYFILGGGSNILLSMDRYDNVISIETKGIELISENDEFVDVKVAAGEEWHNFLTFLLTNNFFGLENLALIPGKCGAAPIQNIGAYGVEQEQFFIKATYYNPRKNNFLEINKEQCQFNYRYSIFKSQEFKNCIITDVTYRLFKKFNPNLNYNDLKKLDKNTLTAKILFDYISEIRRTKIPYPEEIGNAGSFFKNPYVSNEKLNELLKIYPDIPHYSFNSAFKLSAAWLIEKTGMKGKALNEKSDARVSHRHSLILVNNGNASGKELVELSNLIINKVYNLFDIHLEREVNLL